MVVGGLNRDPRCPSSGTPGRRGCILVAGDRASDLRRGGGTPPRLERDRSLAWGHRLGPDWTAKKLEDRAEEVVDAYLRAGVEQGDLASSRRAGEPRLRQAEGDDRHQATREQRQAFP